MPDDDLTVSVPLTVSLPSGRTVTGTLWMHVSRRGRFEVEYRGVRKSDDRTHYENEGEIRAMARIVLAEIAQDAQ
jgi:hypothetical protein